MDKTYIEWIESLKQKIRAAQIKASVAVNVEMILLYWDIGKGIVEKQEAFEWGTKVVEQMAKDLKRELPDTNGFSRTNLFSMRKLYLFYSGSELVHHLGGQLKNKGSREKNKLVQQVGGQLSRESILCKIPWRHHVAIMGHCNTVLEAKFYIEQY